ncbi:MAG: aspartate--tRNA ligase [Candidatus Dormibacteria bacterium]
MCGTVSAADQGHPIVVAGWVNHRRDHGGLTFIDLRDHTGVVQLVFNPAKSPSAQAVAERSRLEWVLRVEGTVGLRPEGSDNPNLPTGEIEIAVQSCEVLGQSEAIPLGISDDSTAEERVRLQYRYLDLRRPRMQRNLRARHRFIKALRDAADDMDFVEIETPTMIPSTPEGARDFIVPSRLWPGHVWALPQSPQIYKQLSMVGGFDRYFQIARCWRDEDLRADRQFEFTQLDLEMSFVDEDEIFEVLEKMISLAFEEAFGIPVPIPWPRLPYAEAIRRYGSDKPDTRFGNELHEVSDIFGQSQFRVFEGAVASGGSVIALRVPGGGELTRGELEGEWLQVARTYGAPGLAYMWRRAGSYEGAIAKFISVAEQVALTTRLGVEDGDLVCFTAGAPRVAATALGAVRLHASRRFSWIPKGQFNFLWVTEFPLFERDVSTGRIGAVHHPFTQPHPDDWSLISTDPERVRSRAYDIVCNGVELGSGSLRITRPDQQAAIFEALGLTAEEAERKFGFLMSAFRYGPPPHGGFAAGVDRIVMLGVGESSIREVIAFPKTQTGGDPMTGSPTPVSVEQLSEVGLRLSPKGLPAKPAGDVDRGA